MATVIVGLALQSMLASPVVANGFLEDRPFQFRDPAGMSALILQEDLRQKKINDLYQPPKTTIYSTSTTSVGTSVTIDAGDNTTVDVDVESSNSGDISAGSELNGRLSP
ncbi:hypothetical protein SH611_05720 [Geminicoccaceae bacterium 1502E]|nr:hypothetical protein [Geminicoccaceae bacterium 1502E]